MSETESFSFFPAAYRGRQLKPTIILLTSLLLSLIWWYFGRFRFYDKHLAARFVLWDDVETTGALYTFVNCFILLGVIPALIVKRVFRENLADYGVQFGDWRRTVRSFLMFAPLFVLAAYIGSRKPDVVISIRSTRTRATPPRCLASTPSRTSCSTWVLNSITVGLFSLV